MSLKEILRTSSLLFIIWIVIQICSPGTFAHKHTFLLKNKPKYMVEIVQIDPSFTDEERLLIAEAALEWQHATNNIVKFIFIYGNSYNFRTKIERKHTMVNIFHMRPVDEDEAIVVYLDNILAANLMGYYDHDNFLNTPIVNMLIVRSRMKSNEEYKEVVMHELGHSIGLTHNTTEGTLMYRITNYSSPCITKNDIERFCELYNCDPTQLHPCVKEQLMSLRDDD